jgi:long-chain acyl-CoA synthetase
MSTATATPTKLAGSVNLARLEHAWVSRFGVYKRLYYQDRSYTNAEELGYAGAVSRILKDHGTLPGDRVLAMMPNTPELTVLLQAIWTAGAIAVPIMPQWTALEASHVLRDSRATIAVTVPPLAPRLHDAARTAPAVKHLLAFGDADTTGCENIVPQLKSAASVETPADRSPDDIALLLYTSGTTGMPKGAMLTHGNVLAALDSALRRNPDMRRGPMLQVLPFSHSFGMLMLELANASGFTSVLLPQFDPVRVYQAIEQHQVEYMPVVPTMLVYLLHHPDRAQYKMASLRRVISGGAALSERVRSACEQAWGCRVEQGYGLSESFAVAAMYDDRTTYRPGSAGPPVPGVEVRIVDDRNQSLPARRTGEVCLAGPHIARGYWSDPEATGNAFTEEWFHTGDIGYQDEDGFVYITDRKKDLIIKGGENISPREIEEVIYSHPAVAEAAVIGVPDPVYGEEVWAFVQLKPGAQATAEAIQTHVGGYVTKFKVPARVVFELALPKNAIGKISKRVLRERQALKL